MGSGSSKSQAKKKPVTKAMMKRYLELEWKVRKLEKDQVHQTLHLKQGQLSDLDKSIKQLQEHHRQCVQRVQKEMKEAAWAAKTTLQSFFEGDATLAKEQSEYLEARNNEEMVRGELEGLARHKAHLAEDVHIMHKAAQKLEDFYAEQDKLLGEIFGGQYGSERENMTESQLDALVARQEKINAAKYKWSNSVVLLQYTVSQLGVSVTRWQQLLMMPDMQRRYLLATETRDNLTSACRNVLTAQMYLSHIEFPYLKRDEVNTVNTAVTNIYLDMQSPDRHAHALNLYSVTHKRAASLLQWLQHVITSTIEPDLKRINEAVRAKQQELKAERLRLIREKMQTLETDSSDSSDSSSDDSDDEEFRTLLGDVNQTAWQMPAVRSLKQQASALNEGVAKKGESLKKRMSSVLEKTGAQLGSLAGAAKDKGLEFQKVVLAVMAKEALVAEPPKPDTDDLPTPDQEEGEGGKDGSGEPGKDGPTPLPLAELAPAPNQEDLFGDIEDLKKRHEQELEELSKVQEMNKVRQEQDLHAKLQARRNRRKRMDLQQQQAGS